MSKNYRLKHKKQTLRDFQMDCHRFSLRYGNFKETEVSCVSVLTVIFEDDTLSEEMKCQVQQDVWKLIDKNEGKWSVPKGAKEIADAYCNEQFA